MAFTIGQEFVLESQRRQRTNDYDFCEAKCLPGAARLNPI